MRSLMFTNNAYDNNGFTRSTSDHPFFAAPSTPSSLCQNWLASRSLSFCSCDMKPSDRRNNTWNWITAVLNHRHGCITICSSPTERDYVSASHVFCTSWAVMPACIPFTAFRTMFILFLAASQINKAKLSRWSCVSNVIGTFFSYGIRAFARLLSSSSWNKWALLSSVTVNVPLRK